MVKVGVFAHLDEPILLLLHVVALLAALAEVTLLLLVLVEDGVELGVVAALHFEDVGLEKKLTRNLLAAVLGCRVNSVWRNILDVQT